MLSRLRPAALDDLVFDVLGLTAGEPEAVVAPVRARLEKARRVR